jgi:hypothetical protein
MSPDWSVEPKAVPYSDLADPQTLNLYGYVRNNPLGHPDVNGHCPQCIVVLGWAVGVELGLWTGGSIYFHLQKATADAKYQEETGRLYIDANRFPNSPGYSQLDINSLARQTTLSQVQTFKDAIQVGQDINSIAGKGNLTRGSGTATEKAIGVGLSTGTKTVSDFVKDTTPTTQNKQQDTQRTGQQLNQPKPTQPPQTPPPVPQSATPKPPPPVCISKTMC